MERNKILKNTFCTNCRSDVFSIILSLFLTGLAYGLAQDNRLVVDKWDAAGIVLSSEANNNLSASTISSDDVKDIKAKETAELGS